MLLLCLFSVGDHEHYSGDVDNVDDHNNNDDGGRLLF